MRERPTSQGTPDRALLSCASKTEVPFTAHRLQAFNTARGVENPLHNDLSARKLGYRAGLIGGVDMYGYLTYAAVQRWGSQWLREGGAECQLLNPVHEGDDCLIVVQRSSDEVLEAELRVGNEVCALARFTLGPPAVTPAAEDIPWTSRSEIRPPATSENLATGTVLPTVEELLSKEDAIQFLRDEKDDLALYEKEALLHPGYLLRLCNYVLSRNYLLGPWIHTSSKIQNFTTATMGRPIQARGRVASHYEQRGHLMVDLDILLLDGPKVLARVLHTAIYKPREKKPQS